MKIYSNSLLTLALCVVILPLAGFVYSENWFVVVKKDFGFKVDFPQKPKETPQTIKSEIGDLKMNTFMHDASKTKTDENLVYMVNYTEYPDSLVNSNMQDKLPDFFRKSIDGLVNNVQGKLLSEKSIELRGFPGREAKVDFRDGLAIINMRLFLVKNKMYIVQTISLSNNDSNKSIDRFMESFDLL